MLPEIAPHRISTASRTAPSGIEARGDFKGWDHSTAIPALSGLDYELEIALRQPSAMHARCLKILALE